MPRTVRKRPRLVPCFDGTPCKASNRVRRSGRQGRGREHSTALGRARHLARHSDLMLPVKPRDLGPDVTPCASTSDGNVLSFGVLQGLRATPRARGGVRFRGQVCAPEGRRIIHHAISAEPNIRHRVARATDPRSCDRSSRASHPIEALSATVACMQNMPPSTDLTKAHGRERPRRRRAAHEGAKQFERQPPHIGGVPSHAELDAEPCGARPLAGESDRPSHRPP